MIEIITWRKGIYAGAEINWIFHSNFASTIFSYFHATSIYNLSHNIYQYVCVFTALSLSSACTILCVLPLFIILLNFNRLLLEKNWMNSSQQKCQYMMKVDIWRGKLQQNIHCICFKYICLLFLTANFS